MNTQFDVAIVGGGPSGSTLGSLLKKYGPDLKVAIVEKEVFPREHIGESLLPIVGKILDEIGVWDAVEAADFPIKIGATYKWGTSNDLWDFNLLDTREIVVDAQRPGKYEGWRMRSTWQVNRATFDKILLDRAAELGCEVLQGTAVNSVEVAEDSVESISLANGQVIRARYYVDASGNAAVIRKALKIPVQEPPALRNIAIWDHWDDAEWAITVGHDATRIQITSLGFGWIWFIPISRSRVSVGLVCPAEYYKKSGKRPEELYFEAVQQDHRVGALLKAAQPARNVKATKDWSFLSERMVGKNWMLVGESAGFADPILSAGISMSMVGAVEAACTILEQDRGQLEVDWLKSNFEKRQKQRVQQHIQFANFWYSANAHFTDLIDYTAEIARDAGLNLDANTAWQWLGTGGFVSLETAGAGLAGHSLHQIADLQVQMFAQESEWLLTKYNVFQLDIEESEFDSIPLYAEGRVTKGHVIRQRGKELPVTGGFRIALDILRKHARLVEIIQAIRGLTASKGPIIALSCMEAMESMLRDGWIKGSFEKGQPLLKPQDIPRTANINWNQDEIDPKVRIAQALNV